MKRFGRLLMVLGILLTLSAAALFGYNQWESGRAERASAQTMLAIKETIQGSMKYELPALRPASASHAGQTAGERETEAQPGNAATEGAEQPQAAAQTEMTVVEVNGNGYIGYLSIPKLGLDLPVMADCDLTRLKTAPCRFSGSTFTDDLVIAAHNYKSHFGSIKKLSVGDVLTFTDMDRTVTAYVVAAVETLGPTAVEEMTASGYPLTLFTCTVGGKARVTVRCTRTD